jgi:hypothetical protein
MIFRSDTGRKVHPPENLENEKIQHLEPSYWCYLVSETWPDSHKNTFFLSFLLG